MELRVLGVNSISGFGCELRDGARVCEKREREFCENRSVSFSNSVKRGRGLKRAERRNQVLSKC